MIEWKDLRFGCHEAYAGGFRLFVGWEGERSETGADPGYSVSFADFELDKRFTDLEKSKKAAERLAKLKLKEALAALGEAK